MTFSEHDDLENCFRTGLYSKEAFQAFNAFKKALAESLKLLPRTFYSRVFSSDDPIYKDWTWYAKEDVHKFKVLRADDNEVILVWKRSFTKTLDGLRLPPPSVMIGAQAFLLSRLFEKTVDMIGQSSLGIGLWKKAHVAYQLTYWQAHGYRSFNDILLNVCKMTNEQMLTFVGSPNNPFKTSVLTNFRSREAELKQQHLQQRDTLSQKFAAMQQAIMQKFSKLISTAKEHLDDAAVKALEMQRNKEHYAVMLQATQADDELKKKQKEELKSLHEEVRVIKSSM